MAESAKLHLTFNPPAEPEQLLALLVKLEELDYDAPVRSIREDGTFYAPSRLTLTDTIGGDVAVYWRSPLVTPDVLAALLTKHGISGRGWMYDDEYGERSTPPEPSERFTFGHYSSGVVVPATVAAIVEAFSCLSKEDRQLTMSMLRLADD